MKENKVKVLFTVDKENSDFLDKYCKMINIPKSKFINNLISEIRDTSSDLFENLFTDGRNISEADGFLMFSKSLKKMNEVQNEIIDLLRGMKVENGKTA